jgi:hypothetical protein
METPSDNDYQIPECPILYPTSKEFANFQEYVNMIEKKYKDYGIVKVKNLTFSNLFFLKKLNK